MNEQLLNLTAAGFFIFVGFYGLLYVRRVRVWPSVSGDLRKMELASRLLDPYVDVAYRYSVDGVDYEGKRLGATKIHGASKAVLIAQMQRVERTGDRVTVFYNPSKPKQSFLVKPGMVWYVFAAGSIAFGAFCAARYIASLQI